MFLKISWHYAINSDQNFNLIKPIGFEPILYVPKTYVITYYTMVWLKIKSTFPVITLFL